MNSLFKRINEYPLFKKIWFKIVFSILFSSAFLFVVYKTCGIWFETNDDVYISEILSGKMTGECEYHIPYISMLLTFPISILYSHFPQVAWWGGFVLFTLFCSISISIFSLFCKCEKLSQIVLSGFLFSCTVILGLHCWGQVEYTSAAILLASSGYMALIGIKNKKARIVLFFLCELVSVCMRDSAMMLVQPLGFSIFAGYSFLLFFKEKKSNVKDLIFSTLKKVVPYGILVGLFIVILPLIKHFEFSDKEWNTYKKWDDACVYLFDYTSSIPYTEVNDILSKYSISEEEYSQFLNYRIWYKNYKFSDECVNELLPRLKALRSAEASDLNLISATQQLLFTSKEFFGIHKIVLILFIALSFFCLIVRRREYLIPAFCLFLGYLIGIIFLGYRNRFVLRVMFPFYYSTVIFLLFIFISIAVIYSQKNIIKNVLSIAFVSLFAYLCLSKGRIEFSYIRRQNELVNHINMSTMSEIADYCNTNSDKKYIVDFSYARDISTDIFETDYYSPVNFIYSGSWFGTAPTYVSHSNDYLGDNEFSVLVYEAQEWKGLDGLSLYEYLNGSEGILDEKFVLSTGATIWVYRFE